jgi:SAM-dependent methyltransferase
MTDTILQAQIDAANAYEALFVKALFGQWAPKVADAAEIQTGQRALDVACGTGVLAREICSRIGSNGHIVGIDPNPGMIAVAKKMAPQIEWRVGMAESLPFPDQSFDAVASQFGLMFFKDRKQSVSEMLRVLVPKGHLAIAVWDLLDNIPAYSRLVSLLDQIAGQQAADALRAPFVLGNRHDLMALLSDAKVNSAEITTHHGTARFPSIRTMVEADLRGWFPMVGVNLPEDLISRILKEAENVLSPYAAADGEVTFDLSAQIITAAKT